MLSVLSQIRSLVLSSQYVKRNLKDLYFKPKPLYFHSTPILSAEPLKKKKRIDPAVLRERLEKKIKRLQRDIRKLQKVAKQYKPISELEPPKKAIRDSERQRPPTILSEAEIQERAELRHLWSIYKQKQHVAELDAIQRLISTQERAMDALEEASPELYEEALQINPAFVPFHMSGPVETPSIEKYDYPDGEFIDVTKKYLPIIPLEESKQRKLGLMKKKK